MHRDRRDPATFRQDGVACPPRSSRFPRPGPRPAHAPHRPNWTVRGAPGRLCRTLPPGNPLTSQTASPAHRLPARPRPGNSHGPGEANRRRPLSRKHRVGGPSVAVRGKADGAHRPFQGTDAVRYTSVDTATQRPAATQGDTPRDTEETARIAENPQLTGRFRRWWQVLGSNQGRRSRRFYRPLSLCTSKSAADQLISAGQMRFSISYAFMPSAPWELARPRTGSGEATDGPGQERLC